MSHKDIPHAADIPVRIDEYTDDSYEEHELDALDVPLSLRSDNRLADVADNMDGIEEADLLPSIDEETVDTGVRRPVRDEASMGLGAEPHSAEELEEAALGHSIRGKRGVTREDEAHGSRFLDDESQGQEELH